MAIRKLSDIIMGRGAKHILILCHRNADPDAICSSYALSSLLRHLKPDVEVEVASPESVSRASKAILERFPMKVINDEPNFEESDVIFMLDTNTVQQLGEWGRRLYEVSSPIIVIDHHAPHPETEKIAALSIYVESASATCEIIYGLFKEAGVKPSKDVAEALLLGIATDTKHFALARSSTFKIISELVDLGVDVQEALQTLTMPVDISERIARLKACRRMKLMRVYGWIIAFSHVGSFQASAAKAIIDLGADLAVVGSEEKGEISISMRANNEFHSKTGLHLGRDLANPLGEFLRGMGGGHATSAGVNGSGDLESAFKYTLKILREKLKSCQRQQS